MSSALRPSILEIVMQLSAHGLDLGSGFYTVYLIALALSGVALLVAASGWAGATLGTRILSALFGFAFLGYAFYLAFIFEGGEFRIFFYAFIAPIALIVKLVNENSARKLREADAERAAVREAHKQQRLLEEQQNQNQPSSGSPSA
jgi:hypothetical protein